MVISMDVTSDQTMSSSPPVDHLGEPGGANQSPSPFQSQSSASGQVAGGGIVSAETDGGGGDEHEDEHSKCSGQTIVTSQHHYHQKQQQQQQTQPPQHLQQEQMLSSGQNPEKTTTGGSEQQQQEHERMVLSSGGSSFDEDDKRLMMSVDADEYDLEQDDQEQEAVSGTAGMRANLRLEQAELEAQLTAQAKSTRFRQATTGVSSSGRVGETREIVESSLVAQMRDIVEGGGGASSSSASAGLKRVPAPEQTRSSSGSQVMINDDDNNNEDVEVDVDDEDEDDETRGANRTTKAEPTGNENQGAKSGPKPKSSSDSLNNQNENGHSRASIDTASQKRLRHSRAHCRHHHHHNHHGHHGHHHHGHHHHHHHHGHHSHHHHHRHRQSVSGGSLPGQVDSGSGAGAELATSKPASSSHPPHHQHSHPHSHHHHHGHSHGGHGWHRHPNSSHPHHHHQNQQQHEHKRGITSKRSSIQPLSMATIEPSTGTEAGGADGAGGAGAPVSSGQQTMPGGPAPAAAAESNNSSMTSVSSAPAGKLAGQQQHQQQPQENIPNQSNPDSKSSESPPSNQQQQQQQELMGGPTSDKGHHAPQTNGHHQHAHHHHHHHHCHHRSHKKRLVLDAGNNQPEAVAKSDVQTQPTAAESSLSCDSGATTRRRPLGDLASGANISAGTGGGGDAGGTGPSNDNEDDRDSENDNENEDEDNDKTAGNRQHHSRHTPHHQHHHHNQHHHHHHSQQQQQQQQQQEHLHHRHHHHHHHAHSVHHCAHHKQQARADGSTPPNADEPGAQQQKTPAASRGAPAHHHHHHHCVHRHHRHHHHHHNNTTTSNNQNHAHHHHHHHQQCKQQRGHTGHRSRQKSVSQTNVDQVSSTRDSNRTLDRSVEAGIGTEPGASGESIKGTEGSGTGRAPEPARAPESSAGCVVQSGEASDDGVVKMETSPPPSSLEPERRKSLAANRLHQAAPVGEPVSGSQTKGADESKQEQQQTNLQMMKQTSGSERDSGSLTGAADEASRMSAREPACELSQETNAAQQQYGANQENLRSGETESETGASEAAAATGQQQQQQANKLTRQMSSQSSRRSDKADAIRGGGPGDLDGQSQSQGEHLRECAERALQPATAINQGAAGGETRQIIESSATTDRRCRLCWCCCCPCSALSTRNDTSNRAIEKPKVTQGPPSSPVGSNYPSLPNVPLDEIRSWGESFDKLMKCSAGRKVFQDFLRCEYSEENILFWAACEELKKEKDSKNIASKARDIYEDYISILSSKEVSLDSRVRDIINNNIKKPTSNIFDEAQLQIYTLMHRDSYPRFINSIMYKKLAQIPVSNSRKSSS